MSGSDSLYDVVFRGDVVPGQNLVEVKQRLAKLFHADPARIDQLFSGRPVALKKNVDQQTAERYKQTLHKAGAIVTLQLLAPEPPAAGAETAVPSQVQNNRLSSPAGVEDGIEESVEEDESAILNRDSETSITLADVGADVLTADERKDFEPREVDTSALSLSQTGVDLLAEDEKKPLVDRNIDTSHIKLDGD